MKGWTKEKVEDVELHVQGPTVRIFGKTSSPLDQNHVGYITPVQLM